MRRQLTPVVEPVPERFDPLTGRDTLSLEDYHGEEFTPWGQPMEMYEDGLPTGRVSISERGLDVLHLRGAA